MTIQLLIIRLNFEVKVDSLGDMANGIKVTYNGTRGFPYSGINHAYWEFQIKPKVISGYIVKGVVSNLAKILKFVCLFVRCVFIRWQVRVQGRTVSNMSPLLLCSVFILMLTCTFTWAGQNFVSVADCPKDANGWELRSKEKSCYGDTPDYLCAAIENKEGEFGEICTKYGLTPSSKYQCLSMKTFCQLWINYVTTTARLLLKLFVF